MTHPEYCTRCEKSLTEAGTVWLELNCQTGNYHQPGDVKAGSSQGCFPFGTDCAKIELAEAARRLARQRELTAEFLAGCIAEFCVQPALLAIPEEALHQQEVC